MTESESNKPKKTDDSSDQIPTKTLPASDRNEEAALCRAELGQSSSPKRFRILRPHAEGGLGKVSLALDQELNRHVALKEIKPDFVKDLNSRSRFTLEAEITGGLEHPGIVPVYGLGMDEGGQPFYAMRFIRGDSLKDAIERYHDQLENDSAAESTLLLRQLLSRFIDVCNAIEYAHSRGVLHRDLKPGNIMLGKYGETVVVDWGLAKLVERDSIAEEPATEPILQPLSGSRSAPTQIGSALGTPAFMSPEQAAGKIDRLGPESDVYSLGATLYYLLTNRAPFTGRDANQVIEQVKRSDFAPPKDCNAFVPPGLDAICVKAMAAQPSDRYATPLAFADDIERWLADEPIQAGKEPVGVRARRWFRKHPRTVASLAATLLVSLASAVTISAVVFNSNQALTRANTAEQKAREEAEEKSRQLAIANEEIQNREQEVRQERDIAVAINEFINNDLLAQASPENEPDRDIKLRTVLDRASGSVDGRFIEQPLIEAAIRHTIGDTYRELGEFDAALPQLERSSSLQDEFLGPTDPTTLATLNDLGLIYQRLARFDDAEKLHRRVLNNKQEVLGERHPSTLNSMTSLAMTIKEQGKFKESEELLQQVLEMAEGVNVPHDLISATKHSLALAYQRDERTEEAERLFVDLFEENQAYYGLEHPETINSLSSLAAFYVEANRLDVAEPLLLQSVELSNLVMGEVNLETLIRLNNLAYFYTRQQRYEDAEKVFQEVIEKKIAKYTEEHPSVLVSRNNLAQLYREQERYQEAIPIAQGVVDSSKQVHGDDHPTTIAYMYNEADLRYRSGDVEQAILRFKAILEIGVDSLPPNNRTLIQVAGGLADAYKRTRRYDDAEALLRERYEFYREALGEDDSVTGIFRRAIINLLGPLGKHESTIELLEQDRDSFRRQYGPNDENTLQAQEQLAGALYRAGRYEDSAEVYRDLHPRLVEIDGEMHRHTLSVFATIGIALKETERIDEAIDILETWLEQVDASGESPEIPVETIQRILMRAQIDSGRPADAEPILRGFIEKHRATEQRGFKYADDLCVLGYVLMNLDRFKESEQCFRESMQFSRENEPDSWFTFHMQWCLGISLLGLGEQAASEVELLAGYEGLLERSGSIPDLGRRRTLETFDFLIGWLERNDKQADAEAWTARKNEFAKRLSGP